jgi:butyryl-CoA dehydrogenase
MLLTPDQEMIRDAVRAFATEQLWPNACALGTRSTTSPKRRTRAWRLWAPMAFCVPEEFGGANLDYVTLALVLEEIAAGDGGTSTGISVDQLPGQCHPDAVRQ